MTSVTAYNSDEEHKLLAADDARQSAMEAMDLDLLAPMLGEDLVYIHSSGKVDTKAEYLAGLVSGHISYTSVVSEDPAIWIVGDLATVYGVVDIAALVDGVARTLHGRSLASWIQREGAWVLTAISIQRIVAES